MISSLTIKSFQSLIASQPQFFPTANISELITQLTKANDLKQIADVITIWSQQHPEINVALKKILANSPESVRGIGGSLPSPEAAERETQEAKETLLNAIRRFSAPETPDPPPADE